MDTRPLQKIANEKAKRLKDKTLKAADKTMKRNKATDELNKLMDAKFEMKHNISFNLKIGHAPNPDGGMGITYQFTDINKTDPILLLLAHTLIKDNTENQLDNDAAEKNKREKFSKKLRGIISNAKYYVYEFINKYAREVMSTLMENKRLEEEAAIEAAKTEEPTEEVKLKAVKKVEKDMSGEFTQADFPAVFEVAKFLKMPIHIYGILPDSVKNVCALKKINQEPSTDDTTTATIDYATFYEKMFH